VQNDAKNGDGKMAALIEESEASPEVMAVNADIKATRKTDWISNFWKALANHPVTLKRMGGNINRSWHQEGIVTSANNRRFPS
jgi:hypothetical protein